MARYIDADKLVESLRADYDREGEKADTYAVNGDVDLAVKYSHGQFCYLNAMERVKDAPTADVAPRAEVEKIIEEVKKKAEAYFWHQDSVATSYFIEFCDDLKKKYTGD